MTAPAAPATHALRDHLTMLRRNLLHARRYPSLTLNLLLTPVILLLLFVYVFGDVMSAGITGGPGDRSEYIAYVVPGVLLMTVGGTAIGTAVSVASDMTEGIIARFRTMAISRASVLIGHVVGSVIQTLTALAVVLAVGLAIGFRPDATPVEWLAAAGLLTLFSLALIWIAVGMGLVSPNAEGASNLALPLMVLPLLSSAFVPVDAMPGWFSWFAEYQPFSPATETLRGLLLGSAIGTKNALLTVGWCLALTVLGYFWSRSRFTREPRT
ncbi:ABC transporter permease [Streptomyces canus]|uniref:ABC transporter permease n=1 Tax=Streptomyces canus TaxID=58343 RepID=UPI002DDC515A|nr:ABC transporter permease [Streptomyces canus]WSD87242.1 ABC transporter permease [Streptomyces canus]